MNVKGKLVAVKIGMGDVLDNLMTTKDVLKQADPKDSKSCLDTIERAFQSCGATEDLVRDILRECDDGDDSRPDPD